MFGNMTKRMKALLTEPTQISINGEEFFGDSVELDDEFVTITTSSNTKVKPTKIFAGDKQELEIVIHGNVKEVVVKNGNVSCHDVSGDVTVQAGNINCDHVGGDVKTGTGNIIAKKVRGDLKTGIGNISLKG